MGRSSSDGPKHWTEYFADIGPKKGRTRHVVLKTETDEERTKEAESHCKSGETVHRIDSRHRCSEKGSYV